jgi:hypothetical protein
LPAIVLLAAVMVAEGLPGPAGARAPGDGADPRGLR